MIWNKNLGALIQTQCNSEYFERYSDCNKMIKQYTDCLDIRFLASWLAQRESFARNISRKFLESRGEDRIMDLPYRNFLETFSCAEIPDPCAILVARHSYYSYILYIFQIIYSHIDGTRYQIHHPCCWHKSSAIEPNECDDYEEV